MKRFNIDSPDGTIVIEKSDGGKGSGVAQGYRTKQYEESKLWENMKKVAELKNCTGDPDEAYVLEFQTDEINIKCDPNSKSNYAKFKEQGE